MRGIAFSWLPLANILTFFLCVTVGASSRCGKLSDCSEEEVHICALDKNNVCFKHFDSKCHMEYEACKKEREYLIYTEAYCELTTFMCDNEFQKYVDDWYEHENLNKTIFSIYKKENKQASELLNY